MIKICRAGLHEFQGKHCKDCSKVKASQYYQKHKEEINNNNKHWMLENKEARSTYKKKYRQDNNEKIKEYKRNYQKCKLEVDIRYRLMKNLRGRLSHIIKGKTKYGSAIHDLGCTLEQFKIYIESKFQMGMSWDNYGNKQGNWSIDHIIPLSRVDLEDKEQFLKVNHYSNLQPLWHVDNMRKGNKIVEKELNK